MRGAGAAAVAAASGLVSFVGAAARSVRHRHCVKELPYTVSSWCESSVEVWVRACVKPRRWKILQ